MSIVTVLVDHIAETKQIQLLLSAAASGIHWKQDWPCNQTAKEADGGGYFKVAEEEKAVD